MDIHFQGRGGLLIRRRSDTSYHRGANQAGFAFSLKISRNDKMSTESSKLLRGFMGWMEKNDSHVETVLNQLCWESGLIIRLRLK